MFRRPSSGFALYLRRLACELRSARRVVLLLIFLSVTLLVPYFLEADGGLRIYKFGLFLIVGLTALALIHKIAFFVTAIPVVLAGIFYLHIQRVWGGGQLRSRIEASLESPPDEMLEYLQSHVNLFDFFLLFLASCYLILLLQVVFRMGSVPPAVRLGAIAVFLAWSGVFIAIDGQTNAQQFPPLRLVLDTVASIEQQDTLKDRSVLLKANPLQAMTCAGKYNKIVIVLGESAISDHMSLFGYARQTTPFAQRSGPHAFDALSPSNQTRYALPMMLTSAAPGRFATFYKEHSLIGVLRACGFTTTWISNQGRVGEHDSLVSSLAYETDQQLFLNEWSFTDTKYDGEIIGTLKNHDIFDRQNHATFVHLIGSHTNYVERYPPGFGLNDVSSEIEAYDNSILYSDFVLEQLYTNFHDENLLFIYVSDHGQVVTNSKTGSGFDPAYKEEYRVPLLIWTRDEESMAKIYRQVANEKLNTASLYEIILFLVGATSTLSISTSELVSSLLPDELYEYDKLTSVLNE